MAYHVEIDEGGTALGYLLDPARNLTGQDIEKVLTLQMGNDPGLVPGFLFHSDLPSPALRQFGLLARLGLLWPGWTVEPARRFRYLFTCAQPQPEEDSPVATSTPEPVTGQNPVKVPLYTPLDVARYLRLPLWGVLALTGQLRDWPEPKWFFHRFPWGFPYPLIQDDILTFPHYPEDPRITFHRFAEVFVRAAALQTLAEWGRFSEWSRDEWESLHHGVWRGLEDSWHAPDLFEGTSAEDRLKRAASPFTRLNDAGMALLRKWLALRLERVDLEDGQPARLYPFSRDPAEDSPRLIVLDPRIRFGRPTITGRGTPTDILFERYQAGDSISGLADDYTLPVAEVEEAVRYEATRPTPVCPFFGW